MTPERLTELVVATLRRIRRHMNSRAWQNVLDGMTPPVRRDAGLMAGRVLGECVRLEAGAPASIAAAVERSGPALIAAIKRVDRALERPKALAPVIAAGADLVGIAMRLEVHDPLPPARPRAPTAMPKSGRARGVPRDRRSGARVRRSPRP